MENPERVELFPGAPEEIEWLILSFLTDLESLAAVSLVNKHLDQLAKDNEFWENIFKKHKPDFFQTLIARKRAGETINYFREFFANPVQTHTTLVVLQVVCQEYTIVLLEQFDFCIISIRIHGLAQR